MLPVPCICFSIERSLWIMQANLNGVSGAHVSLLQYLLSSERSTVLLANQSCFLVTTIPWHQLTGSPNGTQSKTSKFSSWMRSASTCFCQWIGTCAGVWQACGSASDVFKVEVHSFAGHTLNVEAAYLCKSQSCNCSHLLVWSIWYFTPLWAITSYIIIMWVQFILIIFIWTYNNFGMLMKQLRSNGGKILNDN